MVYDPSFIDFDDELEGIFDILNPVKHIEAIGRAVTGGGSRAGTRRTSPTVSTAGRAPAVRTSVARTPGVTPSMLATLGRLGATGGIGGMVRPGVAVPSQVRDARAAVGIQGAAEPHLDRVAETIKVQLAPQLGGIRDMLDLAEVQRTATSEHNVLTNQAAFRREVLRRLTALRAARGQSTDPRVVRVIMGRG